MIDMTGFGKRMDVPGGRRAAPRKPVLLRAAMHTLRHSRSVTLFDVSKTGAQMNMPVPLACGLELMLRIGTSDIFGTVVRVEDETCGIAFEEPLDDALVEQLQAKGKVMMVSGLTPDEMLGAEDWQDSLAR
jgi:hypothetical protein